MGLSGKLYPYVGPGAIRARSVARPCGLVIESPAGLRAWLMSQTLSRTGGLIAATFVIDPKGAPRLADRRSEHVACAGGGPVLSACELFFSAAGEALVVEEVSNLSIGYCPEPESWAAVGEALDRLGVPHAGRFTTEVVFRRCPQCGEGNVVWMKAGTRVTGGGEVDDDWPAPQKRWCPRSVEPW